MYFLSFPAEIRFEIYAELLVQDVPIKFEWRRVSISEFGLIREYVRGRKTLEPAILRTNRQVNREAVTFLYSNNRFVFPSIDALDEYSWTEFPHVSRFLRQIGANGGLLRHICLKLPYGDEFSYWAESILHKGQGQDFQLIRQTCTDLRTIKISADELNKSYFDCDLDRAEKMLRALDDGGFGTMHSLERIVVVIGTCHLSEDALAYCERLKQRMPSCKWSVELKQARYRW